MILLDYGTSYFVIKKLFACFIEVELNVDEKEFVFLSCSLIFFFGILNTLSSVEFLSNSIALQMGKYYANFLSGYSDRSTY